MDGTYGTHGTNERHIGPIGPISPIRATRTRARIFPRRIARTPSLSSPRHPQGSRRQTKEKVCHKTQRDRLNMCKKGRQNRAGP
jgi:hypothetical protein